MSKRIIGCALTTLLAVGAVLLTAEPAGAAPQVSGASVSTTVSPAP